MQPIPSVEQLTNFFQGVGARPSSKQAEKALAKFDVLAPSSQEIYSAISSGLGVDDARQRVSDLRKGIIDTENAIEGVEDSVLGRTSNALVSQAQVDALTRREQEPLFDVLGDRSRELDFTSADLSDLSTRADRLLGFTSDDISRQRGSIVDRLNLALAREEEAKKLAEQNAIRSQFQSLFDQIGSQISAFQNAANQYAGYGSQLNDLGSQIDQGIQRANSSRFIQPAATNKSARLQVTGNPQKAGKGTTIQGGSAGLVLQGKGALPGGTRLSVSSGGSGQKIGGVGTVNPGTISGVSPIRKRTIGGVVTNPYNTRSLVVR